MKHYVRAEPVRAGLHGFAAVVDIVLAALVVLDVLDLTAVQTAAVVAAVQGTCGWLAEIIRSATTPAADPVVTLDDGTKVRALPVVQSALRRTGRGA